VSASKHKSIHIRLTFNQNQFSQTQFYQNQFSPLPYQTHTKCPFGYPFSRLKREFGKLKRGFTFCPGVWVTQNMIQLNVILPPNPRLLKVTNWSFCGNSKSIQEFNFLSLMYFPKLTPWSYSAMFLLQPFILQTFSLWVWEEDGTEFVFFFSQNELGLRAH